MNEIVSSITVKLELWDVVDKAKKRGRTGSLKTKTDEETNEKNEQDHPDSPSLDAETIDVLKGTNAVIFTFNPTKKWTWEYIEREIIKIPTSVYVLIVVCLFSFLFFSQFLIDYII